MPFDVPFVVLPRCCNCGGVPSGNGHFGTKVVVRGSQISFIISWSVAVLHLHALGCDQTCSAGGRLSPDVFRDDAEAIVADEPVAVCQ